MTPSERSGSERRLVEVRRTAKEPTSIWCSRRHGCDCWRRPEPEEEPQLGRSAVERLYQTGTNEMRTFLGFFSGTDRHVEVEGTEDSASNIRTHALLAHGSPRRPLAFGGAETSSKPPARKGGPLLRAAEKLRRYGRCFDDDRSTMEGYLKCMIAAGRT